MEHIFTADAAAPQQRTWSFGPDRRNAEGQRAASLREAAVERREWVASAREQKLDTAEKI